jgi:hypothetical protein
MMCVKTEDDVHHQTTLLLSVLKEEGLPGIF